uniref:Glycerol kinase 5 n=1 Tax=Hirondellea gigas TaxID=1518452 RepID=A0A6A7FPS1_9CRUS
MVVEMVKLQQQEQFSTNEANSVSAKVIRTSAQHRSNSNHSPGRWGHYFAGKYFNSETIVKNGQQSTNRTQSTSNVEKKYIASLDLGTTTVRCFIFNKRGRICARAEEKVELLHPKRGYVEMDPEQVWSMCKNVIQTAVTSVGVQSVISLGVCTQRCTFLTWDAETGQPLHNLITWQDIRADQLVNDWNNCWTMKAVRWVSAVLHFFTRSKRYKASSVVKYMNAQVVLRLKWVLDNTPLVQQKLQEGRVKFGTLDTWILYKLTNGKVHATDPSNASGTALYDPFLMVWSGFVMALVGLPRDILPEMRTSAGDWGTCAESLLGQPLPITAVVSDQGASLIGGGGYTRGHIKLTLGTGGFLNLNTGRSPHSSVKGIYPVVGWQEPNGVVTYMAEGSANDIGTIIEWGKRIGLYSCVSETADLASSVADSGGVYFVPAFQGLQAPINDSRAGCGFLGISPRTSRAHLVRALLDSLAFIIYQMYETLLQEAGHLMFDSGSKILADGGVSSNRVLLQHVATLCNSSVTRYTTTDLSALGAAVLAAVGAGVFATVSDFEGDLEVECVFEPQELLRPELLRQYNTWRKVVQRFKHWEQRKPLLEEP